ncbi:MAG: hypothetical protein OXB86_02395 [Bdellovibrionales bacterium]|nr:hypothetical protein [Bdellovibrionales bacterium]
MDFLKDFISILNLDNTFFVQFAVVVVFYFVTTRLFFNSYLERQEQRQSLTKGRMVQADKLEQEIEAVKEQYAKKTREVHQKFQVVFQKIRQSVLEEHKNQMEGIETENRKQLEKERVVLLQKKQEAEEAFLKERPSLVKALVKKLEGNV